MRDPDGWKGRTESAAWETVTSLREQLRREQALADRLAPFQENWRKIVQHLDELREACGLEAVRYLDVVRGIADHVEALHQQVAAFREQAGAANTQGSGQVPGGNVVKVVTRWEERHHADEGLSREVVWFARMMERLRREQQGESRRRNKEQLFRRIEGKFEQLEQAPRSEIVPVAAELASLALDLALLAQSVVPYRESPERSDEPDEDD